jgi:hypothetical protein
VTRGALALVFAAAAGAGDAPNLARESPPAARVEVREAVASAVRFLVGHQNADGSFGGLHAFRSATTAICWMGLSDAPPTAEGTAACRKALAWLARHARVKRAHGGELYNTWALGFGLQAVARALRTGAEGATADELRAAAADLVAALGIYQTPDGGWGYYDFATRTRRPSWSTSFSTATCLLALRDAEEAGVRVPPPLLDRAVRHVVSCRKPDGTYLYGSYMRYAPLHGVNQPQGSSLRAQACNLALRASGVPIADGQLRAGLEMLVEHHRFAVAGLRRPIPHESWYAVSGYFYLYGYAYAALVLERLEEADRRRFAPEIACAVLKARQPDGSFWDYPLYGFHKAYGTGLALMALARCAPHVP